MSIPNTQNSVMGVTVRGANARRTVNSTASAGRTVGKPALFQVRVVPDGEDTVAVSVWLPKQLGGVVRRNGWPVSPQYAPVDEEGEWYTIASTTYSATEEQVVVRLKYDSPMRSKPTGWEGDLYWVLSFEAASSLSVAEISDRHETPVVLATIKNGALLQQLHIGTIETWYAMPDSEVDDPFDYLSLGWRDTMPSGSDAHYYELYRFCQLEQIDDLDLTAFYSGSANKDRSLSLVIRTCEDAPGNVARIDYAGLDQLMDEYAKDPGGEFVDWLVTLIDEYDDNDTCEYKLETGNHCPFTAVAGAVPQPAGPLALVWDAADEKWKFEETAGNWWEQGGGAAMCYGTAIGDGNKAKVIDLAAKELVGAWAISAGGSLTIPSSAGFSLDGRTVSSTIISINGSSYELLELV